MPTEAEKRIEKSYISRSRFRNPLYYIIRTAQDGANCIESKGTKSIAELSLFPNFVLNFRFRFDCTGAIYHTYPGKERESERAS